MAVEIDLREHRHVDKYRNSSILLGTSLGKLPSIPKSTPTFLYSLAPFVSCPAGPSLELSTPSRLLDHLS